MSTLRLHTSHVLLAKLGRRLLVKWTLPEAPAHGTDHAALTKDPVSSLVQVHLGSGRVQNIGKSLMLPPWVNA